MPMHTESGAVVHDEEVFLSRLHKRSKAQAKSAKVKREVIKDSKKGLLYK